MKTESLLQYVDGLLGVGAHPDYRGAMNGLQVEGRGDVSRIGAAVDASEETIRAAVEAGVDLLLVHHGLFWGGPRPVTGPLYRKLGVLLEAGTALVGIHLPLDAHPELGNCILLARALDLDVQGRFGSYEGAPIGWWGSTGPVAPGELQERVAGAVGGPVRLVEGGPERIERVAVLTGGGGSFIEEAASGGFDALVTGEGSHHTYVDAMELGIHVYYGGHYRTETFGVRALAAHLAERFDLSWEFFDFPSGL